MFSVTPEKVGVHSTLLDPGPVPSAERPRVKRGAGRSFAGMVARLI